ncbi:MAG TPA: response regulator transcription factor [Burkholderiaceae bacterium]
MKIAVLTEDTTQNELVCQVLGAIGHTCMPFENSKDLLAQLRQINLLRKDAFDMLVMDWQLSDMSAEEILRHARNKLEASLPVLFMTSRSSEDDIVAGLAAGANDYMIKPIRRGELAARVQALLRRAYPSQSAAEQIQFGSYVFEPRPGRLLVDGGQVDLTQKEFDLALLLFRNMGRPLSRAYIHESVWVRDQELPSRTMDTHVSRVRNKLKLRPENGYRLVPVYSYGYRLEQLSS